MFEFRELYSAWLHCRRNKRNSKSALAFELDAERWLFDLSQALNARGYRPSPYVCFLVRDPKLREVFAAPYHDRVIHHLLVDRLEPRWERRFIHDSWAGRVGKGLHGGVDRVQGFARKVSGNGRNRAWYLKLDIRSMFVSIDRGILYERLRRLPMDEETDWLVRTILTHDPIEGVVCQSPRWLMDQVPAHKSLFHAPPGKGLPIGNLTSQFFANVYLDALDQFVKHQLRCRCYARYMDDMLLLDPSRQRLEGWLGEIERFVTEELALQLHQGRTRLQPVSNGIDFLGYIIRPRYRLVRRRVLGRMKERLQWSQAAMTRPDAGGGEWIGYSAREQAYLQAALNSYAGHLRRAPAHKALRAKVKAFPFLQRYFRLSGFRFQSRWRRRHFANLRSQWGFLRGRFPEAVLLVRVGRFLECFNEDALLLNSLLGLRLIKPRRGFHARAGWTWCGRRNLLETLRKHRIPWVLVGQRCSCAGRVRERQPLQAWIPQ